MKRVRKATNKNTIKKQKTMASITSGFHLLFDSVAGYLLIVAITSGYPLITKLLPELPPQVKKSLNVHPSLPDLQQFNPLECLVLYLMAYPALAMYRSGGILGCFTLALALMGVLGGLIGPEIIKKLKGEEVAREKKLKEEEVAREKRLKEEKDEETKKIIENEKKKEPAPAVEVQKKAKSIFTKDTTSVTSKLSSNLTTDTSVSVLQEESSTPTMANKAAQAGDTGFESDNKTKEDPSAGGAEFRDEKALLADLTEPTQVETSAPFSQTLTSQQIFNYLCSGCKQKLESKGVRIGNLRTVVKRHSETLLEDEDALSVVTWDPAFTNKSGDSTRALSGGAAPTEDPKHAHFQELSFPLPIAGIIAVLSRIRRCLRRWMAT